MELVNGVIPINDSLHPLLDAARELGSKHVALLGSALEKPLDEVGDLDVHVVLPRMHREAFLALSAAAETTIAQLAASAGRAPSVELRHGPFKPGHGELQLHLLIDDEASLERLPCALLVQRQATGKVLAGAPLPPRTACESPHTWIAEARTELSRWRDALIAREIPYRHWIFEPEARLIEARAAVTDLQMLLRGAAKSCDAFYRPAVWMTTGKVADPFSAGLQGQSIAAVLEVIDRRLAKLGER
ncbi:MAG TPA: hypothetical protein VF618_18875 [Thermoanaerobaculia bacterium]